MELDDLKCLPNGKAYLDKALKVVWRGKDRTDEKVLDALEQLAAMYFYISDRGKQSYCPDSKPCKVYRPFEDFGWPEDWSAWATAEPWVSKSIILDSSDFIWILPLISAPSVREGRKLARLRDGMLLLSPIMQR